MLDIKKVGLDRYAREAEVLMLAWAVNDQPPQLWLPEVVDAAIELPDELLTLIANPACVKIAWNAAFEKAIFRHALHINIAGDQWIDPSLFARYAGLPGKLALVSQFLKLGDKAKDKRGSRLIQKFCKPYGKFKKYRETSGEDWETFKEYCRQDVVAEREVMKRLQSFFNLPEDEWSLWHLDQEINERGMPVSMEYVNECRVAVGIETARLQGELEKLTGLENPNSVTQLLPWLKKHGYPFNSLGKAKVLKALEGK
jgi:DNA polymerase